MRQMHGDDIVAQRNQRREQEAKRNREAAPNLAALVDEMREQFPGAKLMWGKDLVTGFEVGQNPEQIPEEKIFRIPDNYHPTRDVKHDNHRATGKSRSKDR